MSTEVYSSKPQGKIPNNRFPLPVHRNAIPGGGAETVKERFRSNGWSNNWDYPGVYEYAHRQHGYGFTAVDEWRCRKTLAGIDQ
jgi:uncharacterized protein YjlB